MKRTILLISLVILVLGGMAIGRALTVGTSADFPPFEYVEDGEFVGFDMDLIRAIADVAGLEIEIVDMSFDSLIPALAAGQLDIVIAGMTITEDRQRAVSFSDPYWTADQSVVVREDSEENLTVLFGNKRIGVQTGTTGDLWVEENLLNTGILTGRLVRYDTFVMAMTDLANRNIDAIVLDSPVAERFAAQRPVRIVGIIVTGENYGIAVSRGNEQLVNTINKALRTLEDTGKIGELVEKHFQ